jgi:hypothetical protein
LKGVVKCHWQPTNLLVNESIDLGGATGFLGVRPPINDSIWQRTLRIVQNLVQGRFRADALPAASHEGGVDDDTD